MVDITKIPLDELLQDLEESRNDIIVCQKALAAGVISYSGGSTARRLKINQEIVEVIRAELERRGVTIVSVPHLLC